MAGKMDNPNVVDKKKYIAFANDKEAYRLALISDLDLMKDLATKYCTSVGRHLGGYRGGWAWDVGMRLEEYTD